MKEPIKVQVDLGIRKWLRRLVLSVLGLVLLAACIVAYANLAPSWAARGRLFDDPAALPDIKVALVFGTTDRLNGGGENPYFRYRIDAAEAVWKAGKVKTFIVSGDNRSEFYNEPDKMKQALIERGIPSRRIIGDFAGLRTLDSVVRAKEIFGLDSVIFISQPFQNERGIYLAQANGIDAYGFNARDVSVQIGFKTKVREIGARVKMWLDVHILGTQPRHGGPKVALPE